MGMVWVQDTDQGKKTKIYRYINKNIGSQSIEKDPEALCRKVKSSAALQFYNRPQRLKRLSVDNVISETGMANGKEKSDKGTHFFKPLEEFYFYSQNSANVD